MDEKQKFLASVEVQPNGCWYWTGRLDKDGYGRYGRSEQAHRAAYRLFVGPPPRRDLDHFVCDTPRCANPAHVRPASHRENVLRGQSPAAHHAAAERCAQGHRFTHVTKTGKRRCRTCEAAASRRYRARVKVGVG